MVQMRIRSAQQCRDRYEMLLAALQDSRAQLPTPAGKPGVLPQTAPPGALLAGQAQAASSAPRLPPASLSPAADGAVCSASAGLSGSAAPAQHAPAQHQVAGATQGTQPGSMAQHSAAPAPSSLAQQAQQQQHGLALPHSGTALPHTGAVPGQGTMQAVQNLGAAWSLSSELQTLREHLAWLASSNIVCSIAVSPSCSIS